jgi:hypothetical protein
MRRYEIHIDPFQNLQEGNINILFPSKKNKKNRLVTKRCEIYRFPEFKPKGAEISEPTKKI